MIKKIIKTIILVLAIIGFTIGISMSIKKTIPKNNQKKIEENVFSSLQQKEAEITSFYTYGRAINITGKINGIKKDNFESAKLIIKDGKEYEKTYKLNHKFDGDTLIFSSDDEINSGIILDNLDLGKYYIILRIKMNNSVNPKLYSLKNSSEEDNIKYYSITKNNENKGIEIKFDSITYNKVDYSYFNINVNQETLPEDVYDIVIDAGHGGKDTGEKKGTDTEADITLEYAKKIKELLEQEGLKVKLTRDDNNTSEYTYTNMYDENGRITIACESKAKYMLSLHINNGYDNLKGLEIYSPCKSDLSFAEKLATSIESNSSLEYSNNNSFKKSEGVYVRNFTKSVIKEYENTANTKGYAPYNITTDTPYLYTIREVGGIATNAYVDGRNTAYDANKYYNSNQGIECYQIELGYIKNDLEIIKNEQDVIIDSIVSAIKENI